MSVNRFLIFYIPALVIQAKNDPKVAPRKAVLQYLNAWVRIKSIFPGSIIIGMELFAAKLPTKYLKKWNHFLRLTV